MKSLKKIKKVFVEYNEGYLLIQEYDPEFSIYNSRKFLIDNIEYFPLISKLISEMCEKKYFIFKINYTSNRF